MSSHYLTLEQAQELGLAFIVEGTGIEAYRLINGLTSSSERIEGVLKDWNDLESEAREEVSSHISWLLQTASVLILQLRKDTD